MTRSKHGDKVNSVRCKGQIPKVKRVGGKSGTSDKSVTACFPVLFPPPFEVIRPSLARDRSPGGTSHGTLSTLSVRSQRTAPVPVRAEEASRTGRLKSSVVPSRYTLCIKPDFQNSRFEGSVLIECALNESGRKGPAGQEENPAEVSRIVLNAVDLRIGKVIWADEAQTTKREASDVTFDLEQLTIFFDPPLSSTENKGILIINFSGDLGEAPEGFYRVTNLSPMGKEKVGGVTRFSPTFARKCFPCWDEPQFKAKFNISLILPKSFKALSNMPIQGTFPHRTDAHLHVVEFATTPVIPTYLLAFAVGEFERLEGGVGTFPAFVPIGLHVPIGRSSEGQFALRWTEACLEFYHQYFHMPLNLDKLDILSSRENKTPGTGNWGLITCHESELLLEPAAGDDLEVKLQIARTVSHTVVRQWIGSLVTLDWWSGLWVIEGLVTLLQHMCLEAIDAEFTMWPRFVGEVVVKALEADTLSSTHPLDTEVQYPPEIKGSFDVVTIGKGAAVMRMCQQFLGVEAFQRGVQEYLKRFKHRTASSTDFLDVLEETSQKPVHAVFDLWTKQSGFPVITIEEFECHHGTTRRVTMRQKPFLPEAIYGSHKDRHHRPYWIIPVQVTLSRNPSSPVQEFLMDKRVLTFDLTDTSEYEWFMLNPGFFGYYRVKYPTEMLELFHDGIKSKSISPADRLGLLNNQHALTLAGYALSSDLFEMLESFEDEDDFGVWKEIDGVIGSLDILLQSTDCYDKFKVFVRFIFRNIFETLDWSPRRGESSTVAKLRILVVRRLVHFGHTPCLPSAVMEFRDYISGATTHLQSITFQAGMCGSGNDDEVFGVLIRHFKATTCEKEKREIIQSLGFSESESVVGSILEFSISEFVTPGETVGIMDGLMQNGFAKDLAWEFFVDNVATFQRRFSSFPGSEFRVPLIEALTKYLVAEEKLEKLITLFNVHEFRGTGKVLQESLDRIKLYSAWFKRDKVLIGESLAPYHE